MHLPFEPRPMGTFCLALLLAVPVLLVAGDARAQAAASGPAESLFIEARALQATGRVQEACEKFAASQALEPAPGTLLNLAGCYEALGRTATAWATYRQASAAALERGKPQWVSVAEERAQRLEPLLARIRIDLREAKANASVRIQLDQKTLEPGALGSALPVDPGPHEVLATRAGATPFNVVVQLRAGQTEHVHIDFDSGLSARPALPSSSKHAIPMGTWILGGAAAASLGVGFVFLGLRESSASELHEQGCSGALAPDKYALCTNIRSAGDVRTIVEVAGFVAAGAFTVAAVALALAQSKPVERVVKGPPSACLPTFGGIACLASF